ncbi:DUF11 domain-containing protein [Actinomadura sp. KC216]|uniref:DUF11 domain-containing protein n=1 Tax=Actinomadura sp. KC216 TaxID=2530370 RepID=UPI0014045E32|nr:DUF11 domain-containing protein [Actinomadura sp. KC216]
MIRTWKVRGLVLLTAAPLLAVVPAAAVADAGGPARSSDPIRLDGLLKPPPKPKTHTKAKAKAKVAVALRTSGPARDVIPGRTYEWKWTIRVAGKPRPKQVKAKKRKAKAGKGKAGKLQTSRARPREAVFWTTLPKSLAFVSGERQCASSGWRVVCRMGAVRRGGRVSGVIRARVVERAKPGQRISPLGTVTWAGTRVTRRFPAARVAATADLAITRSAPARARAGAKIPYRVMVRNNGPATAQSVMVLSEGPVKLVGWNTACVPGRGAYVCSVGSLRAGESRTLRLTAVPRGSVRAGTVLRTSWTAASPTLDLDRTNNGAVTRTRIIRRR